MHLLWMSLLTVCLLSVSEASETIDGSIKEDSVNQRDVRFWSGYRRHLDDRERLTSDITDNGSQEINSNDDDPRRTRTFPDGSDGDDLDQTSRSQIRVLSAGFRRTGAELRPLHDPTLTDEDLNKIDDHNIENELKALSAGLEHDNDVKDSDDDENNYGGLGIDDIDLDLQDPRLDINDFDTGSQRTIPVGPPWSEWRHCNITCGVGQQLRWRRCRDDTQGVCNRVTGRQEEWRRCLGMECDRKTIEELGGGCKDHLLISLMIGILIGSCGSFALSAIVTCLYSWCKKPSEWKLSDYCPNDCCAGCGESCAGCGERCYDPYTGCCAGCGGTWMCCWCLPCCDPYAQQDRLYYHKQLRMNNAYLQQHDLGPGRGESRMPYKRPPAPLPRESVKKKPYYDEPEYADIDHSYYDSPRKKRPKEKQNYVTFTKNPVHYESVDGDQRKPRKSPEQVENDYIDILGDDAVENAYLTPTIRGERYESDYEYLDAPPGRPR